MPFYIYKCNDCDKIEEIKHGIDDNPVNLSCGHDSFVKIPQAMINIPRLNKEDVSSGNKKVGDLVKNTIEETKEFLRSEKLESRKKLWKQ